MNRKETHTYLRSYAAVSTPWKFEACQQHAGSCGLRNVYIFVPRMPSGILEALKTIITATRCGLALLKSIRQGVSLSSRVILHESWS